MHITDLSDAGATASYLSSALTLDVAEEVLDRTRALVADVLGFEHPPAGAHVLAARLAELDGDAAGFVAATRAAIAADASFGPAVEDQRYVDRLRHGPGRRASARTRALHLFAKLDEFSGRPPQTGAQIALAAEALGLGVDVARDHGERLLAVAGTELFLGFLTFEGGLACRFAEVWGDLLPRQERELLRSWAGVRHRYVELVDAGARRSKLREVASGVDVEVDAALRGSGWPVGARGFVLLVPVGDRTVLVSEPMVVLPEREEAAHAAIEAAGQDAMAVAHVCLRWLSEDRAQLDEVARRGRIRFALPDVEVDTFDADDELAILDHLRATRPVEAARADAGDVDAEAALLLDAIVAHRLVTGRSPSTVALAVALLAAGRSRESVLAALREATYAELSDRHVAHDGMTTDERRAPTTEPEAVPGPTALSCTVDAIELASANLGDGDLLALLDGEVKLVMPITGDGASDAVLRLDELMLDAVPEEADARLVLVTRRRTGPSFVLEDELAIWRRLRAQHEGRALVLCDWLVFVRDEVVLSLAELAGPPAPWA